MTPPQVPMAQVWLSTGVAYGDPGGARSCLQDGMQAGTGRRGRTGRGGPGLTRAPLGGAGAAYGKTGSSRGHWSALCQSQRLQRGPSVTSGQPGLLGSTPRKPSPGRSPSDSRLPDPVTFPGWASLSGLRTSHGPHLPSLLRPTLGGRPPCLPRGSWTPTQLGADLEVRGGVDLEVDRVVNAQPAKSRGPGPSSCPVTPTGPGGGMQQTGVLTPRRSCSRSSGCP